MIMIMIMIIILERRKITKLAKEYSSLSERQKLRRAVKEKKSLPKLTGNNHHRFTIILYLLLTV